MKPDTLGTDLQIATETLRYSTDIFAQALAYRLGYEKMWELRHRAEKELGARFDIRDFHAAITGDAAIPLDLLDEDINRIIARRRK